ncbi:hypothetical protein [Paenibacillus sp. GXUN7292]|uniref:hypothetical protein n=1 Tax=Paenibacillus sp. GXUN7292 TaxID=3422499 RepID=UPI003D7E8C59
MKKGKLMKIGLFIMLTVVLVFTSSISATSTVPEVSRVQYFTVQNNNVCSATDHHSIFYFNLNNISSVPVEMTVHFYNDVGDEITYAGSTGGSYGEYRPSSFIPGTPFSLNGKSTGHYYTGFGKNAILACNDIPAYGKIVIHSDTGLVMANGEIRGVDLRSTVGYRMLTLTPISVNGGNPF